MNKLIIFLQLVTGLLICINPILAQFFNKKFDFTDLCRSDGAKHDSLDKLTYNNNHLILSSAQWNSSVKSDSANINSCSFTLTYKSLTTPLKRGKTFDEDTSRRLGTDSVVYEVQIKTLEGACTSGGNNGIITLKYFPDNATPVELVEPLCSKVYENFDKQLAFSHKIVSRNPIILTLSDLTWKSTAENELSVPLLPYVITITSKSDHPDVKFPLPPMAPALPSSRGDDGSKEKEEPITRDENGNRVIAIKKERSVPDQVIASDQAEISNEQRIKRQYPTSTYPYGYGFTTRYGYGYTTRFNQYNQNLNYRTPAGYYNQYGRQRSTGRRIARIGGGIIAAIVIACLLCCGVCFGICFYLCSKRGGENSPSWMKGMPSVYRQDAPPPPQGNVGEFQVGGPQYVGQAPPPGGYYPIGQPTYNAFANQAYPLNPTSTAYPNNFSQLPYPVVSEYRNPMIPNASLPSLTHTEPSAPYQTTASFDPPPNQHYIKPYPPQL